jgi:glycerophosphoryl diester phosphodiesterase
MLGMLFLFLFLCLLLYIWSILPNTDRRERANEFATVKYAHRGLHDELLPENSLGAFEAAIEKGFGIELDVRLTKRGELVVFHDDNLERMCGVDKKVSECTYEELLGYRLLNTDYKIPLLSEVLKLVAGRTDLLIEIKECEKEIAVSKAVIPVLREYKGRFAVQSFSPYSVNYIAKNADEMIRGILVSKRGENSGLKGVLLENFMFNCYHKPDFVSVNKNHYNTALYIIYKICRVPAFAWTVRSIEEEKKTETVFKTVIFENYIPSPERKSLNNRTGMNALKKNKQMKSENK